LRVSEKKAFHVIIAVCAVIVLVTVIAILIQPPPANPLPLTDENSSPVQPTDGNQEIPGLSQLALDMVQFAKAVADLNPEECASIVDSGTKDSCLMRIISDSTDSIVCQSMPDSLTKETCYLRIADATKNPQNCEGIPEQQTKDNCYSKIALLTSNSELCKKISDTKQKEDCLSYLQT